MKDLLRIVNLKLAEKETIVAVEVDDKVKEEAKESYMSKNNQRNSKLLVEEEVNLKNK